MEQYEEFFTKYAAYEEKHMEKDAFIENLIPYAVQHIPTIAQYALPPEGALGIATTAGKILAMKGATTAGKALKETFKLKKRFNVGTMDAFKMRGTPAANKALGVGLPEVPQTKGQKILHRVDVGSDVASVAYNVAQIGKHLF